MTRGFWWISLFSLLLIVGPLYGGFLHNPPVFDDGPMFLEQNLERLAAYDLSFGPRYLAYLSFGWTYHVFGQDLVSWRMVALCMHVASAFALYVFLQELAARFLPARENSMFRPQAWALIGAILFAVHPVAVYGAGYLAQRTTVLATLFLLLMLWSLLRGLYTKHVRWLIVSASCYAAALLSKEHSVMAPAVAAVLTALWWRTHGAGVEHLRSWMLKLAPLFTIYLVFSVAVVLQLKGLIGHAYEPWAEGSAEELVALAVNPDLLFPLSVVNQGALFFKYLGLWLVPGPMWMSVDMRESFPTSLVSWPQTAGFVAFIFYPILAFRLLWKGGPNGLVGFALLAPWMLFLTEYSTVRIQEPFVLYRSYLWLAPAFAGFLYLAWRIDGKKLLAGVLVVVPLLFALAYQRLGTFSHPLLLWDDAAALVEYRGQEGNVGVSRIYFSRAKAFELEGRPELAVSDYGRALQEGSRFYRPYLLLNRGALLVQLGRNAEAIRDFSDVIALDRMANRGVRPVLLANAYMGRGVALKAVGRAVEAELDFVQACKRGWAPACEAVN